VRFKVRAQPIVGTSIEYLEFRGLRIAEGRAMAMLGECVLGSRSAEALEVSVGGTVITSPESVFDIAGVYPLKMQVVGVLEPSYTADDIAVFVDLKTAWIVQGLVHGHQDMAAPESATGVLSREGDNIVANASVIQYTEITPENIDSFHFHGSTRNYPISAVIVAPHDQKSGTILMGRFESLDIPSQILQPTTVIDDLLGTIFTVQNFVVAGMLLVGLAALATAVLVFVLSLRLRKREIETMAKQGPRRRGADHRDRGRRAGERGARGGSGCAHHPLRFDRGTPPFVAVEYRDDASPPLCIARRSDSSASRHRFRGTNRRARPLERQHDHR